LISRLIDFSVQHRLAVLLAVPFSAVGAIWFLFLAGYNMSVAVWVGLIALLGIDAETGVFMLRYLDLAYQEAQREGRLTSLSQLREAIVQGAVKRLRPKFMTFVTTCIGLFPIMWATGAGSDVMKRIAAPMVGGIFTSFLLDCCYIRRSTKFGGGAPSGKIEVPFGVLSRWNFNRGSPLPLLESCCGK
jgi:Cu(I)/Ag(I) efflux system membrane protein CusA/SilA